MNVISERPVIIFKNEYNGKAKYVVGISKKNQDGEYENANFSIQFNKDVELHNKAKIKLTNAWLSFYSYEFDGKKDTKFFIKCSDFELVEKGEFETTKQEIKKEGINIPDSVFEEFAEDSELDLNF